jgi:hypothetical protein
MEESENGLMQQKQHIKKEKFIEALEQSMGIISHAAKKIGVDRTTPYRWMREDEEYKSRVEEVLNVPLDFVESKLFEAINHNNITAIIFYLKTKGKHRGYVERHELTGIDDKDIKVEIEVLRTDK